MTVVNNIAAIKLSFYFLRPSQAGGGEVASFMSAHVKCINFPPRVNVRGFFCESNPFFSVGSIINGIVHRLDICSKQI